MVNEQHSHRDLLLLLYNWVLSLVPSLCDHFPSIPSASPTVPFLLESAM